MRLIDTDKLIVEVVRSGNIVCLPHFSLEQINTAPVVEAIPINIIKEELDYAHKMYNNSTELTEPYWRGSVSALEMLIIRWKKENEHNK